MLRGTRVAGVAERPAALDPPDSGRRWLLRPIGAWAPRLVDSRPVAVGLALDEVTLLNVAAALVPALV